MENKITRDRPPALLIEGKTVSLIFSEDEIAHYVKDSKNDDRRMIVISKETYDNWIIQEYNELKID